MTDSKLTMNHSKRQLSPSTDWQEVEMPGEQQLFEDFASRIIATQQQEAAQQDDGTVRRGFHAKPHAGLVAEFQVLDNLPEYARFGVFRQPQVFPAVVRFSNGKPSRESDNGREPRGISIKLIGVPGDKLPPGNKADVTQDFLATSHSVTSTVRNAVQFFAFIEAMRGNKFMLLFNLARKVGWSETFRILFALIHIARSSKIGSVVTEHYAGTAPIKLGPYAVKFTVRPTEETEDPPPPGQSTNFLREVLAERLRKGDVLFDFVVQFYVDEEHTPIEDTSIPWKPENAPFIKVAQLRIQSCDLDDPVIHARSDIIEQYAFSPWHTIEEHRPLGNIMRARRVAYQASASLRGHLPEPTSLPDST